MAAAQCRARHGARWQSAAATPLSHAPDVNEPFLFLVRTIAACPEHSRDSRRSPKPRGNWLPIFPNQAIVLFEPLYGSGGSGAITRLLDWYEAGRRLGSTVDFAVDDTVIAIIAIHGASQRDAPKTRKPRGATPQGQGQTALGSCPGNLR